MSDTNQVTPAEEEVILPEADVMEDAPPAKARKGMSPTVKVFLLGGGIVLAFGGALMFSTAQTAIDPSVTRRPAQIDSTPGGTIQRDSVAYQESLRDLNERRAQAAEQFGVTSIPTPEVILEPTAPIGTIDNIDRTAPPAVVPEAVEQRPAEVVTVSPPRTIPRPPPAAPRREPAQSGAQPPMQATPQSTAEKPQENPYSARVNSMMARAVTGFAPKTMTISALESGSDDAQGATPDQSGPPQAGAVGAPGPDYSAQNILMRPGDVLYAETLTTVTSDMKSPVLAEVVHGPHKGARLVGEFTAEPRSDRMVVNFTNITFADGSVYDLSGVGVDAKSAETAVASDVERRYIARYAPILGATFINGYANAMAQPRQTVVGSGDSAQVVTDQSTSRMAIASGLAAASSAIATDIASTAPRGPKIILQAGWPIGVLITDRVLIDTPVRTDNAAVGAGTVPYPGMPSQVPEGVRGGTLPVLMLNQ